jgi:hypothetical protein
MKRLAQALRHLLQQGGPKVFFCTYASIWRDSFSSKIDFIRLFLSANGRSGDAAFPHRAWSSMHDLRAVSRLNHFESPLRCTRRAIAVHGMPRTSASFFLANRDHKMDSRYWGSSPMKRI